MTGPAPALDTLRDPYDLFRAWFAEAEAAEVNDANAMTLATVDAAGRPAARIVLLKGLEADGFVFYTNTQSRKGDDLSANPVAALLFHWKSLRRQVRIEGRVEPVTAAEADAYFATRPRGSRIGAWASLQSRPLDARATLEQRVAALEAEYAGRDVPRPAHWSGYRVLPDYLEFWQDREFRLHDRITFHRSPADRVGGGWEIQRLYP
ncbi:MAG: pyridoxamine 5-phosphate oxidase [Pseudomonadota bacterium]|jgi:pyridoxamine 5'-phosphate oxidase